MTDTDRKKSMKPARLALVLFVAAWSAAGQQASLPAANTILERYVDVTGGKAAYEKRHTEISTGAMEVSGKNVKGTAVTYSNDSGDSYTEVEIQGVGEVESGVTHGVVWETSAIQGPRIKQGEERESALRDTRFNAPLHWRTTYYKVQTVGLATVEGQECYKVSAAPPSGSPETLYFSTQTGLLVRRDKVMVTPRGDVPVEFVAAEYKDFDGVKTPSKMLQKAAGQEFVVTIDSVKVNEAIPASRFELPAGIKALLAQPNGAPPKTKSETK